ncbi:MAG: cadmium resistance transporter [Burkholderiaceae bacterium]|nr:cadmium resistance transporter [Burkholderiaceae bacterium]
MDPLVSDLGIGIGVFASTNIDDLFLLAAFFADPQLRHRSIVIGQYLGIGALVLVSASSALLALAFPDGWVALLGVVPLLMGLRQLLALRTDAVSGESGSKGHRVQDDKNHAERGLRSQVLAVASVTVANGADNVGVYVPLFATDFEAILTYALTFAVMTGVWCALGYLLVNHKVLGGAIRRYGNVILPVVLISLGLSILSGASVLLR